MATQKTLYIKVELEINPSVSVPAKLTGHPDTWHPDESEPAELSVEATCMEYAYNNKTKKRELIESEEISSKILGSLEEAIQADESITEKMDEEAHEDMRDAAAEAAYDAYQDRLDYETNRGFY